jgi:hypothetical protein
VTLIRLPAEEALVGVVGIESLGDDDKGSDNVDVSAEASGEQQV